MKVAVIGGGWAGLAAAVELTEKQVETTLFEAGRQLGGRARSLTSDGRRLDNGQHILLGAYRETLALMRRVGVDPEQLLDRRCLQVIDNQGFRLALPKLPAPLHLAWGLLGARGVGLREKVGTALWMARIKNRHFRLQHDMTVAEWLDQAGQTGTLRQHLWEPLCLAALNIPAARASAQLFANVLRDSLGSNQRAATDLLLPRVDLGQLLPQPAAAWLTAHGARLRLGQRVRQIDLGEQCVMVDGESFDHVILATAPQHALRLCPEIAADFDYEPIATVYLQFGQQFKLPFPLINLNGNCGQWVVDRGNGLLACILSGHGEWESLHDDQLGTALLGELNVAEKPLWKKVIREQRATFSSTPGLSRPPWATTHRRLLLAGDYTWSDYPATLEGAVRSGLRAGASLAKAAPEQVKIIVV
jgi:squalene-associated FAD-dependent desaturase